MSPILLGMVIVVVYLIIGIIFSHFARQPGDEIEAGTAILFYPLLIVTLSIIAICQGSDWIFKRLR